MFGEHTWFRPIPVAVACGLVLIALVVVTSVDSARARTWARWLLAFSVVGILAVTLFATSDGVGGANLIPGRTIRGQLTGRDHPLGVFNVVGNVAMFVPLGWLVALLAIGRRLVAAAAVGFGLSLMIEAVQFVIGRSADIDDVILNGTGAVLGGCLAMLIRATRSVSDATQPTSALR